MRERAEELQKYKGVFLLMYFVSQYLTSFVTLRSQPSQYMYFSFFLFLISIFSALSFLRFGLLSRSSSLC
jgi:hypothetical protein